MATFSVNGGNATVNFSYTAPTDKARDTLNAAAEWLWKNGFGTYDSNGQLNDFTQLNNQQKLDVVDAFVKSEIVRLAKLQNLHESIIDAEATAETDSNTRYGFN